MKLAIAKIITSVMMVLSLSVVVYGDSTKTSPPLKDCRIEYNLALITELSTQIGGELLTDEEMQNYSVNLPKGGKLKNSLRYILKNDAETRAAIRSKGKGYLASIAPQLKSAGSGAAEACLLANAQAEKNEILIILASLDEKIDLLQTELNKEGLSIRGADGNRFGVYGGHEGSVLLSYINSDGTVDNSPYEERLKQLSASIAAGEASIAKNKASIAKNKASIERSQRRIDEIWEAISTGTLAPKKTVVTD